MRITKDIEQARKEAGLPPIKMGFRVCLRCDSKFFSEDIRNQFNCNYCRREDKIDAPRLMIFKKESK